MLLIDSRDGRDGLWKKNMNGFGHREILIKRIGNTNRTVKGTGSAAGAEVTIHISRLSGKSNSKITFFSFQCLDLGIGQYVDVGMSTDIRHLGTKYSDGAVHRGKRLVQLGHLAPNGRRLFDQVDLETQGGQIQRGLNAADPSS